MQPNTRAAVSAAAADTSGGEAFGKENPAGSRAHLLETANTCSVPYLLLSCEMWT